MEAVTQSPGDGSLCLPLDHAEKGLSSFRFLPAAATTVSVPKAGWEMHRNSTVFREQPLEETRTENHHLGLKDPPLSKKVSLVFSFWR